MMKVNVPENLYIQLEKLASSNFRTPELQLCFILSNIFAGGQFNINIMPPTIQTQSIEPRFTSLSEIGIRPLSASETLNIDDDFAMVAEKTSKAGIDELDNVDWSNARRAFERANAKAVSSMPVLTEEQEEEIRKAHEERVKGRGKVNTTETIEDIVKDNS